MALDFGRNYVVTTAAAAAAKKTQKTGGGGGGEVSLSMSMDEGAVLFLYTMDAVGGVSFYSLMNRVLREPDRTLVAPFVPAIWLLMHALSKCPEHPGRIVH